MAASSHRRPSRRQLALVAIALPSFIALAVLAFAWPAARLQPRNVPVGVVGAGSANEKLVRTLSAAQPDAFDLRLYADESAARSAIRNRDVYGAFVVARGRVRVLTASAAGPAVSQVLSGVGAELTSSADQKAAAAGRPPVEFSMVDVVPLSSNDAKGVVLSSAVLPLTICSIIVAAAVALVVRFRPAWRQIVALTVVSAVAAAGIYLVVQGWLGALPHHGVADWAALSLTILALSAATAGLIALAGAGGVGGAAALFVFVGNPFSAVTSAPEMLPGAVGRLGQWLPPGAGANLLRSTAYFGGSGAGGHVGVLLAWTFAGFALIVLGHHAPIRFAAAAPAYPQALATVGA
jgi:hypothetical protein